MVVTVTFTGVLLGILTSAVVVMAVMLAQLFAFKEWAETQNDYRKEKADRLSERLDGLRDDVRQVELAQARIDKAFLPVVTAWAANQNTPKSEG